MRPRELRRPDPECRRASIRIEAAGLSETCENHLIEPTSDRLSAPSGPPLGPDIRHSAAIAENKIRMRTISNVANTSRSKPDARSPTSIHGPTEGKRPETCFMTQRLASSQLITISGRFSITAQMRVPTTRSQVQNLKK